MLRSVPESGFAAGRVDALLERRPRLALLLLVVLPFLVHVPQWVLPTHSDPIWMFGSLATGMKRAWLPGHAFNDPYIGFTTEALGRLVARDWLHGIVPWWNPYVGIGVPLAGQMQPSAFLLPFVLLLALPGGVTWLIIAMQIMLGVGTRALLLELRLSPLAALTCGALYSLNGTIAWVPGPGAVFCTMAFLPVLLWGIERSRRPDQGAAAILGIAAGIGGSLIAGFPETALLDGLMGLAWAAARFAGGPFGALVARRTLVGGALGLMLAAPLLIAFADEMAGSHLIAQHDIGLHALHLRTLPTFLLPYVYGPVNAGGGEAYPIDWGDVGGYTSALIVLLALVGLARRGRDIGLRVMLACLVGVALLKTFGVPPFVTLVNLVPVMHEVAFFRYAPAGWELALVILAGFGLDALRAPGRMRMTAALIATLGMLGIAVVVAQIASVTDWSALRPSRLLLCLDVPVVWTLGGLGVVFGAAMRWPGRARALVAVMVVLDAAAMFCLPQASGDRGGTLDLAPTRFLAAHAGLSPVVTLGPISPNYGAYFGFGMLNHNMSPVPQGWLDYIDTALLPGAMKKDAGATFWPVKTPPLDQDSAVRALTAQRAAYQAMGVRFVIAPASASPVPAVMSAALAEPRVPLPLPPNTSATIDFAAPALDAPITAIGVMMATYANAADGDLGVQLCAGATCRGGRLKLAEAADNGIDYVMLDGTLAVAPRTELRLVLTHQGGLRNMAVWVWPTPTPLGSGAGLLGPARLVAGPDLAGPVGVRLGLRTTGSTDWERVAEGMNIDVWEMPNPLHFFDADGCTLRYDDRSDVQADCARAATLVRRELFMPGWWAQVNGHDAEVRPIDTVLQQVALPAGHSTVSFGFVPPHAAMAEGAAGLGALGLLWQVLRLRPLSRRRVARA